MSTYFSRNNLYNIISNDHKTHFINRNKIRAHFKTNDQMLRSLSNNPNVSHILGVSEGLIFSPILSNRKKQTIESNATTTIDLNSNSNIQLFKTPHKKSYLLSPQFKSILEKKSENIDNDELEKYEHQQRCINEIKKLNNWDMAHAHNEIYLKSKQSFNFQAFLNSLGSPTMKWLLDIKNNPKNYQLFKRNKCLDDMITKMETEEKVIFNQNMNLNKHTISIELLSGGKLHSKTDEEKKLHDVEFYKEVMREKIRIEDTLRQDLIGIAQELHDKKIRKKRCIIAVYEATMKIDSIEEERSQLISKHDQENHKLNNKMKNEIMKTKKTKVSNTKLTTRIFGIKADSIAQHVITSNEFNSKIQKLNHEEEQKKMFIERVKQQIIELEAQIRQYKLKFTYRMNENRNYFIDILKTGIDVRRYGLSWVIIILIQLKTFIEKSLFPNFLTYEYVDYLMKTSYLQYEINELIRLFQTLKAKQKIIRQKHEEKAFKTCYSAVDLSVKTLPMPLIKQQGKSKKNLNDYLNDIEDIADKYENIIQMCISTKKEDACISKIALQLREQIILYKKEENEHENNDELYFLPGSVAEFFNKDNKFRQYFDDIYYLSTQIVKKENNLKVMRQEALVLFRKTHEGELSVLSETLYAAVFGNGIVV